MKQVVYVDVLLAVNLFVNYFILLGSARFLSLAIKRRRLLLGASLGAFYSLYILLPPLHAVFSLLVKLVMSITIVLATFGCPSFKQALKTTACFYSISFAFGGIIFALWYFLAPPGLLVNNGVVYFDISPIFLVIATLFCYGILRLIHRFTGQPLAKELFCSVEIELAGKKVLLRAKVDTGNSLTEPFSHLPVVVAEYAEVEPLLSEEARRFFQPALVLAGGEIEDPSTWGARCRMVPFRAVSGEGMLPAFRPDEVKVYHGNQAQKKEAYIAVCQKGTLGGEFAALTSSQLIS